MDGAKHNTDTLAALFLSVRVSRRGCCAEAFSRESVERLPMRILARVGCDSPENGEGRKSKVSLAISFSQGLVSYLSRILTEYDDGHHVNIHELIESYIV